MFQALPSVLATGWGRQALEGFREPATGVEKSRWEGSSTGGPCLSWERRHSPRQIDQASGGWPGRSERAGWASVWLWVCPSSAQTDAGRLVRWLERASEFMST